MTSAFLDVGSIYVCDLTLFLTGNGVAREAAMPWLVTDSKLQERGGKSLIFFSTCHPCTFPLVFAIFKLSTQRFPFSLLRRFYLRCAFVKARSSAKVRERRSSMFCRVHFKIPRVSEFPRLGWCRKHIRHTQLRHLGVASTGSVLLNSTHCDSAESRVCN